MHRKFHIFEGSAVYIPHVNSAEVRVNTARSVFLTLARDFRGYVNRTLASYDSHLARFGIPRESRGNYAESEFCTNQT